MPTSSRDNPSDINSPTWRTLECAASARGALRRVAFAGCTLLLSATVACDEDAGSGKRSTAADQPKKPAAETSAAGQSASGIDMTGGSTSVPGKARDAVLRGVDKMKQHNDDVQKKIDEQFGGETEPAPRKMPAPDKDPE